MKVFVGTMYSQEGEFDLCCQRVREQSGVQVTHFVVAGYDERTAHNSLWDEWNRQKSSHDLFVKVDADTVLAGHDTLFRVAELFKSNPRVTGMQAPLYDYMTDGQINGLSAFCPAVIFNRSKDGLFCDRGTDSGHDIVLRESDLPAELTPAGFHCTSSTHRQAFHFGLHRALKNQAKVIVKIAQAWMIDRDKTRAYALAGAQSAHRFRHGCDFNYSDPKFVAVFEEVRSSIEESRASLNIDGTWYTL